ncbi:hypothetical protein JoomaDRAFT_2775 [Galbibacter orientalis DSM 19592]|uniref:Tissue inhibitor of metalloproteinase n=1 Tax=Galbibacter orientalis DSM 19592 TaxID=926559 RepID=I3C7Z7_9FLAO|nr:hypothetical protein [Galbibacter orientalis]EIJ39740.1 hypothetical protein JoomaDRAFT_2775 [Galbibacter orientalis DSM 19592]
MKKILQITIFLFSIGVFACDCDPPKITEKYTQSDFVANVTIIKIYPNQKNKQSYRVDIKINELYKGDRLKSIYVYGRSDNGIGTSCDIYIPENTSLIAYASKNKEEHYGIGMCSGLLYLNKTNQKRQKRELDILKTFKSKNINFTDKISYREKAGLHEELEQFIGIDLERNYGIYEITFASDLRIKNVIEISGYQNPIDKKLIEIIKKTEWTSFDNGVEDKVPDNSKLLIGIYFYPKEKENPSFLSQYYL